MFECIDQEARKAVVIWSGDNASEATFLAMACWQLRQRPGPVLRVAIPEQGNPPYVAFKTPSELADLYASRREPTNPERALLSKDFERIRDEMGLLRLWKNNQVIGVPVDYYDPLLLESCTSNWMPAPRVVVQCPHSLATWSVRFSVVASVQSMPFLA